MFLRSRPGVFLALVLALVAAYGVAAVATSGPAAATGTVTVTIQGHGTVTAPGIACSEGGGDCSELYEDTEECDPANHPPCLTFHPEIDLVAAPDRDGFTFQGFTGCTSTSGRTCSVTVTASKSVTARFADTTDPVSTLIDPAPGAIVSSAVFASATATDNVGVAKMHFLLNGVEQATDSGAPFQATLNVSMLNGTVTVGARAEDTSGRLGNVSSHTIMVDNTAPTIGVTGPDGQVYGPGATQTWTLTPADQPSGVASVGCSVVPAGDPASFGSCSGGTSSHSVTETTGGGYTFSVRVTDKAGNLAVVTRNFSVDAAPPETIVTGGPAVGAVVGRTVLFGLSSTEPGSTMSCRLFRGGTTAPAFAPCTTASSFTASGLDDGPYVFEARAVDAVGNADPTPAVRTFSVDATPPTLSVAKAPNRVVKSRKKKAKVKFAFSSQAGATFRCSLDGAAFAACPAVMTLKVKVGKHTLSVVAVDAVGNVSPTRAIAWKVKRVKKQR
jgi:hypothetical protein